MPTQTIRELSNEVLIFSGPPNAAQKKVALLVATFVTLSFGAALPYRRVELPAVTSFIPVVDTVLVVGDILTAVLLLVQASTLRSRGLICLGAGYLFSGLIIIPHALTFPGAFAPEGLLGAGTSTTVWLNIFWHTGLPAAAILSLTMQRADEREPLQPEAARRMLWWCVVASSALAATLALLSTRGAALLPELMTDSIVWIPSRLNVAASLPLVVSIAAVAALWRHRHALINLWLLLVIWGWLLETVLAMVSTSRFTVVWYTGRVAGLCSGLLMLVMLLVGITQLYGRLAQMITLQHREREGRRLTLNAIAMAMAHEIKQPLASIVANAGAGLATLERRSRDEGVLRELFESIEKEGLSAGQVVDSIRAMVDHRPTNRVLLDLRDPVREAVALVRDEAAAGRVGVSVQMGEHPLRLEGDFVQLKHVLLNLFVNAIEAMRPVPNRAHHLQVSATADGGHLTLTVSDTGVGFAAVEANRIFDAFYTSKPHGTGMGLPLCRSIVETHGGRIVAESSKPHGATFRIILPAAAG